MQEAFHYPHSCATFHNQTFLRLKIWASLYAYNFDDSRNDVSRTARFDKDYIIYRALDCNWKTNLPFHTKFYFIACVNLPCPSSFRHRGIYDSRFRE
jgi:hypothetical protein